MKLRLSYKIFGAFLITFLAIIVLTFIALRFFIYRDFADFVSRVEKERIPALVNSLKLEFVKNRGWENLRSSPEGFQRIIETSHLQRSFPRPQDYRAGRSIHKSSHDFGKLPLKKNFQSRHEGLFLLDRDKGPIVGNPIELNENRLVEIRMDNKIIGWLGYSEGEKPGIPGEIDVLNEKFKMFYMISAGILIIAAIASLILSKHLLAPIKKLTDGTRALTSHYLNARIDVRSNDELGQLAKDFNRMAETLEKDEGIRKQWITDISHELRTPISILRGEIEALMDGVREMNMDSLQSLHSEVVRLGRTVNDLHKVSLADTESLFFKKDPVNPLKVLSEVIASFGTAFEKKRISIKSDFEKYEDETIIGDADRLKELYSNILENTLRYADTPGELLIGQKKGEREFSIFFHDSGPGVPEESLGRLFDRLYRVDKSRSRNLGGSGLGLSICKTIVEGHGGTITAANSSFGGLRIEIVFPLQSAAQIYNR